MNTLSTDFQEVLTNYNKNRISSFFTQIIPQFRRDAKYQANYKATYNKKEHSLVFRYENEDNNCNDTISFSGNKDTRKYVLTNDADYTVPSNFDDEDDYNVIYNYSSHPLDLFHGKLNLTKIRALFNKTDGYFKDFDVTIE